MIYSARERRAKYYNYKSDHDLTSWYIKIWIVSQSNWGHKSEYLNGSNNTAAELPSTSTPSSKCKILKSEAEYLIKISWVTIKGSL